MKIKLIATAAILSIVSANSAYAFSQKTGVIKSVDQAEKSVVVTTRQGRDVTYKMNEQTRVVIKGEAHGIEALAPNQEVKVSMPAVEFLKAEILSIDMENNLVVIRPHGSKELVSVNFDGNTRVSGKVNKVNQLAAGQSIKVRYRPDVNTTKAEK